MDITGENLDVLLGALGEQLGALGSHVEIVVIGGSALAARQYGPALAVDFAGRVDQIHFKIFAMVDQGGGRHEADLRALGPTAAELIAAARWSITQDPSPGYRSVLVEALRYLGVGDADLGP